MDIERTFRSELNRVKLTWQVGLALSDLLRVTGAAVVAVAVCAALDGFLAFPPALCLALAVALPAAALLWLLVSLVRVIGVRSIRAAQRADQLLQSPRHTVQSALELVRHMKRQGAAVPDLQRYLADRIIERAGSELSRLGFRKAFPLPELGLRLKRFLLQLLLVAGLGAVNPEASRITLTRLCFPLRDTPPYSRYEFVVFPREPRVLYGGTIEIGAEITGAPLASPVWCLTRTRGRLDRSACFQENGHRFTQRLERMVSPLEFCFATGKARSRWHRVEVLLQPEIASASATMTPPDYTALAPRHITPGREDFAGYRLSRAELRLVSNRPLLGGLLTIVPKDDPDAVRQVEGERVALDTVAFKWELREEGRLQVSIRDVRGTTNREPLRLQQKLIADRPPEVSLDEPGPFTLATPSVSFQVAGQIADDLGLRKADLVRAVVGYRDRSSRLSVPMGDRRFDFTHRVDLGALGAEPGQILEFYVEAADGNPDLTGLSASDIARVQIITEDEYAAMVRARVTLEEFAKRFDVSRDSMESVIQALQAIQRALDSKDPAAMEAKRQEALETMRRVAGLLEKLAHDFPVFDLEESLAEALKGALGTLKKQTAELDQTKPDAPGFRQTVDRMIEDLGGPGKALQAAVDQAKETGAIGRVMESVARFKNIVSRQAELVRRLTRLNQESGGRDVALLKTLTRRQDELRESLTLFASELRQHAAQLPSEYGELRQSAEAFVDKLTALGVTGLMTSAVQAGENQDARQCLHWATLALEKLRELMSSECDGGFGGMCDGKLRFKVSEELNKTLQQMLAAICQRMGGGQEGPSGAAGGGAIGGDINDGYRVGGYSPLNVPALGPERTSFSTPSEGGRSGNGKGVTGGGSGAAATTGTETMGPVPGGNPRGESQPLEQVPEKYRNAVRRYFGNEGEKHER
jgi:hypothetical protein